MGGKPRMFRPLRRIKNAISDEAAKQLLLCERRGVLAVNGDDGYPFAVPINYIYDRESNAIYFHGAKSGHKIDSLKKCDKVCFTVYGNEQFREGDWAPYVQSTVVFGRCFLINDAEETKQWVGRLALKYYPDAKKAEEELIKGIAAVQLYKITIEHLCGKQIHEK